VFYDVNVGEIGMADSCSGIDDFGSSGSIRLSVPFSDFLFNRFKFIGDWYFILGCLPHFGSMYIYTSFDVLVWEGGNG